MARRRRCRSRAGGSSRWDESLVADRSEPIAPVPNPANLIWSSMAVPGNRNEVRPDMTFARRYFLRTSLNIAPELVGTRSFHLYFRPWP